MFSFKAMRCAYSDQDEMSFLSYLPYGNMSYGNNWA